MGEQQIFVEELGISNFGPFYGDVEIDLRPLKGRRTVLIGGKTGAGKTHLLRALFLSIIGEQGVRDISKSERDVPDASKFRFDQSLNRKAQTERKTESRLSVSLARKDEYSNELDRWLLTRHISHRPYSPVKWRSELVLPNGKKLTEADDIQDQLESLLPRYLARFFFFDAERSQSFDLGDNEILEGISKVLGLHTYEQLAARLRNFNKRLYNANELHHAERLLAEKNAESLKTQKFIESLTSELEEMRGELAQLESDRVDLEDQLKTLRAIDPSELEEMRRQKQQLDESQQAYERDIEGAWRTLLPLALLGGYRNELCEYLDSEERRSKWEAAEAAVNPRIPFVKKDVFDTPPSEHVLAPKTLAFYSERLERALRGIFHPPPGGISDSIFSLPSSLERNQVISVLRRSVREIQQIKAQAEKLERLRDQSAELQGQIQRRERDADAIARGADLFEQLNQLRLDEAELRHRIEDKETELQSNRDKLAPLRKDEEMLQRKVDSGQRNKTISSLAQTYISASEKIKEQVAELLREQLGQEIGELWLDVTQRHHEFEAMIFDDSWRCSLKRKDGRMISWDDINTSAGQKQVRVLAFYESLRRLASLVPPLVVDTPLGRLDSEVKAAVISSIYLQGHQSIILATNSEIDPKGPLFDSMRDSVARAYTLEAHGEKDSPDYTVQVRDNYFGERL